VVIAINKWDLVEGQHNERKGKPVGPERLRGVCPASELKGLEFRAHGDHVRQATGLNLRGAARASRSRCIEQAATRVPHRPAQPGSCEA
jgi:hypothetical protein